MQKKPTIESINEDIVKAAMKKVITPTSSGDIPFAKLTFSETKSGFGFSMDSPGKFLTVRCTDRIKVFMSFEKTGYKKTFLISNEKLEKLTTENLVETYKKYCITTIYSLIRSWTCHDANEQPDLGEWDAYKY